MSPTTERLEPRGSRAPEPRAGADDPTPVLRDAALDRELSQQGYVVIPFLDDAEVARLRQGYAALQPDGEHGLTIDFMRADRGLMADVETLLAPMWARFLPAAFVDHRPVVATFIVKHPDPDSAMGLHHEPTYVDPPHRTFNVWIPLVDVSAEADNGILEIIPGTEHLPIGRVGFDTPPTFRRYQDLLVGLARTLDVRAGSALVYDTRMLHASRPNRSDQPRPAIAASVAPRTAALFNTVAIGRRRRAVHRVDPRFFVELHPMEVAASVASRYPLHLELEECLPLDPAIVQATLGLAERPTPRTVVPDGLWPDDGTPADAALDEVFPQEAPWLVAPAHDVPTDVVARLLATGAVEPRAGAPLGPSCTVTALTGTAASVRWRGRTRRRALEALLGAAAGRRRATLVALDPRAVLRIGADAPIELSTVDGPSVNAGARTASLATTFEPGTSVVLPSGGVVLWNGGPGPLVVLLRALADR